MGHSMVKYWYASKDLGFAESMVAAASRFPAGESNSVEMEKSYMAVGEQLNLSHGLQYNSFLV